MLSGGVEREEVRERKREGEIEVGELIPKKGKGEIINKWLFDCLKVETVFKIEKILLMEMDETEMSVT